MAEDSDNALLPRIGGGGIPAPVLVNPLAAQNAGIQSAQGLWGIREKQAKEAAGQAYQGAVNPQTGEFDPNEFRRRLAASGPAAMEAGAALLNTQNISSNQLDQNLAKAKWVNSRAGAALQSGDFSDAAMLGIFQEGIANGTLTLPEVQRQMQVIPPDAAGRQRWLREHQMTSANVQQQLEQRQGTQQTISAPQGTYVVNVPPISANQTVTVPHTMGPAAAGGQVTWVDKTGTPHQGTGAQWAVEHGAGNTVGMPTVITMPAAGGSAPAIPTGPLPGAYQPRGGGIGGTGGAAPATPPTAAAPATAAPATSPASPAVATPAPTSSPSGYSSTEGPTPGTKEAGAATGTASAGMATELTKRADQVPANKANYANMLADLDRLGKMPPGGEREVAINTFLHKLTGTEFGTMTRDQVAAANSFSKLANIAVGQQLAAIGGTDARQQLFMGSNPNLDLSKLGNQQIIHMLQGNEDAIAAKSRAWQDWKKGGKGDDSYGEFQNDFNHHFDPRVFQQQYMAKNEINDLRASLEKTPGAVEKFRDDHAYAKSRGWVR